MYVKSYIDLFNHRLTIVSAEIEKSDNQDEYLMI